MEGEGALPSAHLLAKSAPLPFLEVPSPPLLAPRLHAAANSKARVEKPKDVPFVLGKDAMDPEEDTGWGVWTGS